MVSRKEIDDYISQYYSYVVDNTEERMELIRVAQFVVHNNVERFGLPTSAILHNTLDEILDRHKSRWDISLSDDLTGEGFTPEHFLQSQIVVAESLPDINKGRNLARVLQDTLPAHQFHQLVSLNGGFENLIQMLAVSNLTPENILREYRLSDYIHWLWEQTLATRKLYVDYKRFLGSGRGVNPIRSLDDISLPIVQRVIMDIYRSGTLIPTTEFLRMGFYGLHKRHGGLGRILQHTNPELMHRFSLPGKWTSGDQSVRTAVNAIEEVLYQIPGYREAEMTGNLDKQVKIINDFIQKEKRLQEFFYDRGLKVLMENFYDPEGIRGVRRIGSPKALFEFYSDKKGLNLFDRTQRTYVQSWRIKEKGMWGKGEESIKLAIEAIDDVLDNIPGYKAARRNADRDQQVIIMNKFLMRESNLGGYFRRHGLYGLMNSLRYPDGRHVLRKRSPKSLLEFYDETKGLRWFDRSQDTYVQAWRIREVDMWQKGEESARLSVEAIEDVLYSIPGYKVAEKTGNRDEQIRLINDLLSRESRLMEFFQNEGLKGLMKSFFDPNGMYGLRRRNSPKALLEFYSDRKNLNWFDRTQKSYLQAWRIRQHNMWNQGEESAQLAIEAIEDVLYDLPGYKVAEKTGNRDKQLTIIDNLIRKEGGLQDYFIRVGLYYGMMMVFWDRTGKHGIKSRGSPKAVLEFYSERKGLNWFDRSQTSYIEPYRNASLRVRFQGVG